MVGREYRLSFCLTVEIEFVNLISAGTCKLSLIILLPPASSFLHQLLSSEAGSPQRLPTTDFFVFDELTCDG